MKFLSDIFVFGNLLFSGAKRYFGTNTEHDLVLKTNDVDRVTIKSDGNVGFGTVAPNTTVHVAGTTTSDEFVTGNFEIKYNSSTNTLDFNLK